MKNFFMLIFGMLFFVNVMGMESASWLSKEPSKLQDYGYPCFPVVHSYGNSLPNARAIKLDFSDFNNDNFPHAGIVGAHGLLSGQWGNTQGGNATFGDVGGYIPGTWEFYFSVQARKEAQNENDPLLFRPQWGFLNLWQNASKTSYTMIENSPASYMRIFHKCPTYGLNFTGAQFVGIPVSFHSVDETHLEDLSVSGPTHQLPDAVQASDSFVIVHRTIYRFGGSADNNKVIYGVHALYSEEDMKTFDDSMKKGKNMREVLLKAPIIKDSYLLTDVLGVTHTLGA